MTHSKWLIGYGIFLFLCGLAGFLSNPTTAKTALISGSVFGGLSAAWGILLGRGQAFAKRAALVTCLLLCGAFTWRAFMSWQAVANGAPKQIAASLITLMLLGSTATVVRLLNKKIS
jgi:uncharacterized membrane protein (UPF0136 family)